MKKASALLLALILIALLAACGNKSAGNSAGNTPTEVSDSITTPAEFSGFIKNYITMDHYMANTPGDDHCGFTLKNEFYPAYQKSSTAHLLDDDKVVLDNGTRIGIGMTVPEFTKQGWKFKNDSEAARELKPNVESGGSTEFVYNGKAIKANVRNYTEQTITHSDGIVKGFSFELYDKDANYANPLDTAVDFSIDNKVKKDSDLKKTLDAFVEPYSIRYLIVNRDNGKSFARIELEYRDQYEDGEREMTIALDGKGSKIIEVDYRIV